MLLGMSNSYRLKSHPNKLLFEHLKSVASATQQKIEDVFPKLFTDITLNDLAQTAFIIGATHDIGKGTTFFQKYLSSNKEVSINPLLKSHSPISSLYCSWIVFNDDRISDNYREFLTMASSLVIQGHHGSLKRPTSYIKILDKFDADADEKNIFLQQFNAFENIDELERISKELGIQSFVKFTQTWKSHLRDLCDQIVIPIDRSIIGKKFSDCREPYFLINLLYSALLDADRLDAAWLNTNRF